MRLDRNSDEWRALFARMSGHYLTAYLPDDWGKWPDDVLENFFEDHVWEPLEHWSVDDVFDQIASLTDDVARLLAERKIVPEIIIEGGVVTDVTGVSEYKLTDKDVGAEDE